MLITPLHGAIALNKQIAHALPISEPNSTNNNSRIAQIQPIASSSRYSQNPYRNGEEVQALPNRHHTLFQSFHESALTAARWVQQVQRTRIELHQIIHTLQRTSSIDEYSQKLTSFTDLLNELHSLHQQYASTLKSELWENIENAMESDIWKKSGILRGEDKNWRFDSMVVLHWQAQENLFTAAQLQLVGRRGLLLNVEEAIVHAEQTKTLDMLATNTHTSSYFLYFDSQQLYWPLPAKGWLLNEKA